MQQQFMSDRSLKVASRQLQLSATHEKKCWSFGFLSNHWQQSPRRSGNCPFPGIIPSETVSLIFVHFLGVFVTHLDKWHNLQNDEGGFLMQWEGGGSVWFHLSHSIVWQPQHFADDSTHRWIAMVYSAKSPLLSHSHRPSNICIIHCCLSALTLPQCKELQSSEISNFLQCFYVVYIYVYFL